MLVLTRKVDQRIIVEHPAGTIVITLVEVRGFGRALIGIDAPSSFPIRRAELSGTADAK